MKLKIILQLLYLFCLLPTSAQQPKTADEVKAIMFVSRLDEIIEKKGEKINSLSIDTIKSIFENNKSHLYGGLSDISKFATLRDLCERAMTNPNKADLQGTLFKLFKNLPLIEGEPSNWNENLIKSEGGALGLITKCLIDVSDLKLQSEVLDYLIRENDILKMKLFINKIMITKKIDGFDKLLEKKTKGSRSKEMKEALGSAMTVK